MELYTSIDIYSDTGLSDFPNPSQKSQCIKSFAIRNQRMQFFYDSIVEVTLSIRYISCQTKWNLFYLTTPFSNSNSNIFDRVNDFNLF